LAIYKPYPYYKVKTRIFATLQAVYLFPQILKTDFRRDRRKSVFACWWLPPPTPFSQNFILRLRTVPALFLPPPAEIFCKRRSWLTSIIANCPAKGSGIFSKNLSGSQSRSQRETLFKGFGMLPQQAKPAVSGNAGNRRFERLYIQTPCLPSSAWLLFSSALDKNFRKGIDRNIRLCYHNGELNTAHIFHADT
jgi:hypothetical protein